MSNKKSDSVNLQIQLLETLNRQLCSELGIVVDLDFPDDKTFNAYVGPKEGNKYQITICRGCFNQKRKIKSKTRRYEHLDAVHFEPVIDTGFIPYLKKDPCSKENYRDTINRLFGTFILLHIYFHEMGHILAGHVDNIQTIYKEFFRTHHGSYETQEYEMTADWYSTKLVFSLLCKIVIGDRLISDKKAFRETIRKITLLYWITMALEYQIVEDKQPEKKLIRKTADGEKDYSRLIHPHPAVRFTVNVESMREGIADLYEDYFKYGEDEAGNTATEIKLSLYTLFQSFLTITDVPIVEEAEKIDVTKYYIKLRDTSSKLRAKSDGLHHLCDLPDDYLEEVEIMKKLLSGEPLQ